MLKKWRNSFALPRFAFGEINRLANEQAMPEIKPPRVIYAEPDWSKLRLVKNSE